MAASGQPLPGSAAGTANRSSSSSVSHMPTSQGWNNSVYLMPVKQMFIIRAVT